MGKDERRGSYRPAVDVNDGRARGLRPISARFRFARQLLRRAAAHDVQGRAAEAAFYILIAIFPTFLAIAGLLSFFNLDDQIETLQDLLRQGIPLEVADRILGEVDRLTPRSGSAMIFSFLLSLYYASLAVATVTRHVKSAWSYPSTELRIRLVGFGLAGILITMLPLVLAVLTAGSWLVVWGHNAGLISAPVAYTVRLVRWPALFLLFQQMVNLIYRAATRKARRWGFVSWGSVFASIAWVAISHVFEWFVDQVTDLGAMYGSLGTAVALLLYAHLVSAAVLIGAEADAQLREDRGG